MLDGQLSFLIGSRRLAALRYEADAAADDADFMIFVAIDSETDALPLGAVREHWDQDALARLEPEIEEAEHWAATAGADACRSLITRFGEQDPNWRARPEHMNVCCESSPDVQQPAPSRQE